MRPSADKWFSCAGGCSGSLRCIGEPAGAEAVSKYAPTSRSSPHAPQMCARRGEREFRGGSRSARRRLHRATHGHKRTANKTGSTDLGARLRGQLLRLRTKLRPRHQHGDYQDEEGCLSHGAPGVAAETPSMFRRFLVHRRRRGVLLAASGSCLPLEPPLAHYMYYMYVLDLARNS